MSNYLLAGWYGQKGMLKTTTWALAPPEFRPISVFAADRNVPLRIAALKKEGLFPGSGPHVAEGVTIHRPDPKRYYESLYEWAHGLEKEGAKLAVWDTVNHTGEGILNQIKRSDYKGERRLTINKDKPGETIIPRRADYRIANERISDTLVALCSQPCHTICVAHERTVVIKDDRSDDQRTSNDEVQPQKIFVGPAIVGQAGTEKFPTPFDVFLRFYTKHIIRKGKLANVVYVHSQSHLDGNILHLAGDAGGVVEDDTELDPTKVWAGLSELIKLAEE